jgi:hypothetical protein
VRHDLWFALRRIRMRPLHSIVVTLTLGLGIGAALAVFAIVDAVLVRPLPYPDAAQLIRITRKLPIAGFPEVTFSDVGYRQLVTDARTLSSAAAFNTRDANLIEREDRAHPADDLVVRRARRQAGAGARLHGRRRPA